VLGHLHPLLLIERLGRWFIQARESGHCCMHALISVVGVLDIDVAGVLP
jgi:hypothetical protein